MPLNPTLYGALITAARRGRQAGGLAGSKVLIKNEGQENDLVTFNDAVENRIRTRVGPRGEGETYWVCCPGCNDTRFRLCINHAWNVKDPVTGYRNRFLMHCFNEACEQSQDFGKQIEALLWRGASSPPQQVAQGTPKSDEPVPVLDPGPCVRVDELPPTHPAAIFLNSRGYDPRKVGPGFGVSYCVNSRMPFAHNRLIFPVVVNQQLIGWQARYVDADGFGDVSGLWYCKTCHEHTRVPPTLDTTGKLFHPKIFECLKCKSPEVERVPKYWTMPGFSKSRALFNFDTAKQWPFVVITEGPTDPIQLGTPDGGPGYAGPGVSLFGHSMGAYQKKLIFENWYQGAAVVLMDPDASESQGQMLRDLEGCFRGGTCGVMLPDGRDPGDCEHDLLWKLIFASAKKYGAHLGHQITYAKK